MLRRGGHVVSALLLGTGLAVSAAIAGVVAWGRVRSVTVPRPARWASAPRIWRGSGVDRARLEEAIRWWRARGHDLWIGGPSEPSAILVVAQPQPEGRAGNTRCWATPDGSTLVRAEVEVRPEADALTIAHELGHALGYLHPVAAPSGHLMHPSRPGWDGRGLEGP